MKNGLDGLNVIEKITFSGVLHLRTDKRKRGYKGPLFKAHAGDLVISKIRVAQGSLCVVPDDLDYLAVSPEYPVYIVDQTKVRAEFLRLVIRSSVFKQRVSRLRAGNTTKARIRPSAFEALSVPVPTLAEQDALIASYTAALAHAAQLEQEAEAIERAAWQSFESALGVAAPPPLPNRPVFVARFTNLNRWSHDAILRSITNVEKSKSAWNTGRLGDVVCEIKHGCSLGPSKRPTALRILKISAVTKGYLDLTEYKYMRDKKELREQFSLRKGDILMCRTNGTLAYVGMSALVTEDVENVILPDKVIRVRPIKQSIDPVYLWRLLQLPAMRSQIENAARTAVGNYAIGGKDIRTLNIPLPPLHQQTALVSELNVAINSAREIRSDAVKLRSTAWAEFESALFHPAETEMQ